MNYDLSVIFQNLDNCETEYIIIMFYYIILDSYIVLPLPGSAMCND